MADGLGVGDSVGLGDGLAGVGVGVDVGMGVGEGVAEAGGILSPIKVKLFMVASYQLVSDNVV
jgi:hypothetical protein